MMLNVFYTCPADHPIAINQDAWMAAPEGRKEVERSLFAWCDVCEDVVGDGYCMLRLEKIT